MATAETDQTAVIEFLSDPASYGAGVAKVERCETHGAIVFLAGERAYKLKRAVSYAYMDFSTRALRRAMCEAELAVNRRAAPDLYLEVRAVVRDAGGKLRFGALTDSDAAVDPASLASQATPRQARDSLPHSTDKILDWVVVMRRFEQADLFEEMRKRGALTAPLMRRAAEAIAEFHRGADIRHDFGGAVGIRRVIDENAEVLTSWSGRPFDAGKIEDYERCSRAALTTLSPLLEARRENGFVRRCHGDLHLNNICLIGGEPVLFDAIEFSEEFSRIDVFYDLAFLLMDLEHRRLRPLANILFNRYLECSADFGGIAALPLFLSCRAAVRAHVMAALADRLAVEKRGPVLADAAALLNDAIALLKPSPPELVVLGGLSGTGKSTLARAIAPKLGRAPGAVILRSDVIRKRLWGVDVPARLPQEAYAAETTARVFAEIAQTSAKVLAAGHGVIADAVYGLPEERAQIEAVARDAGVRARTLWLEAPLAELERRVAARAGDASDATVEVVRWQAAMIAPPTEWRRVGVSGTEEDAAARVMAELGL
ncbi:MAG: AAA family ATPase [Proteobacteria bacterium]|nr:AAA family ATPase [Pseudomonadota bacterium]